MRVDAINKQNGLVSAPVGDIMRTPMMEHPCFNPNTDQLQTVSYESPIKRQGANGIF